MKKIVFLILTFILLTSVICLISCRKQPDTTNTVAYFEHGFSMEQKAILRYEYNEHGNLLNILVLDWNTLFPVMTAATKGYDISYRYDKTGKLISHTFHGANMVLEYDESGHVKHGRATAQGRAMRSTTPATKTVPSA